MRVPMHSCNRYSLISNHQLDTDQRVSCAVAIILSLIKVLMVWQMTIFLLRIPRQQLNQPFQRKLVLVCLINVMVISGNQWLVTSLNENETFPLEQLYFGDVAGKAIGVLLEPFGTIYGFHAVIMAFESYQDIMLHGSIR